LRNLISISLSRIRTGVLLILFIGCASQKIPDNIPEVDYQYRKSTYFQGELISYEYYDKNDQLIEQIGEQSKSKYTYDEEGKLIEVFHCRGYNCQIGERRYLVYDQNRNHTGDLLYTGGFNDLHWNFVQVKFYDQNNRLMKERVDVRRDSVGNPLEYWKYYEYRNNRLVRDVVRSKVDTVWITDYRYNTAGLLVLIQKRNGHLFENVSYEYSDSGLLLKETTLGNRYPITKRTSFSRTNCTKLYEYDNRERLIKKVVLNHQGKPYYTRSYSYQLRSEIKPR